MPMHPHTKGHVHTAFIAVIVSLLVGLIVASLAIAPVWTKPVSPSDIEQVAATERELTPDVDYEATTPYYTNRTQPTTKQVGSYTANRYVSFSTLKGSSSNELIITRIVVESSANVSAYPFKGFWEIDKNQTLERASTANATANYTTLNIDLSGNPIRSWVDDFDVWFAGGGITSSDQYSFKVYGYYQNDETSAPSTTEQASQPESTTNPSAPADPFTSVSEPSPAPERALAPAQVNSGTTYASPWANNPGPLASSTHDMQTSTIRINSRNVTSVSEDFELGGPTGALISSLNYRYTGQVSGANLNISKDSSGNTPFHLSIEGVIDTDKVPAAEAIQIRATPYGTLTYDGRTGTQVGWRYPIKDASGGVTAYVDIMYNLKPDTDFRDGYGFNIKFVDASGRPVQLEVPAYADVNLKYAWTSTVSLDASKASLTVNGTATGVVDVPVDGGADEAIGQCSPTGGTVWVGASSHTNPGSTFNDRNSTQLYTQQFGSTTFTKIGEPTNWVYNALSYNPKDGYLYAVSQGRIKTLQSLTRTPTYADDPNYPAGHLLRISPVNGAVTDMGRINGIQEGPVGTWPNDLWGGITSGFIAADGKLIFSNSSQSGTKDLYTLQIGSTLNAVRLTNTESRANDYSFNGGDTSSQYVYGMRNGTTLLERIDLTTGATTTFDMSTVSDALGNRVQAGVYGTAWTYPNGNLGFGNNATQISYQVRITEETTSGFKAELISASPAPTSQSNDATSNALVVQDTDLKIEKTLSRNENGVAEWEIRVTNVGPCGSSGFNVTDFVPDKYNNVSVNYVDTGWVQSNIVSSTNGNTIQALHGPLAAGKSATLRLTANYRASVDQCVENTASVYGNEGDDAPDNNQDSDGACSLLIRKDVVDVNADGVIDGGDTSQAGPNGTRAVTYRIVVENSDKTSPAPFTLRDTPRFADIVRVQGGTVKDPSGQIRTLDDPDAEGSYVLATDASVPAASSVTYEVTFYYTPPAADANYDIAECSAGAATPGNGLYNLATVDYGTGTAKDDACGPIVEDGEVTLFLQKVNDASQPVPLEGAEFTIFESDGTTVAATMTAASAANPGLYSATLKPNVEYVLVETKSPADYSLLAQPIHFSIVKDEQGNAVVQLPEGSTSTSVVNDLVVEDPSPTNAYISLVNFHQGSLPKTGGHGYLPWLVASLSIMLAGAFLARRKTA